MKNVRELLPGWGRRLSAIITIMVLGFVLFNLAMYLFDPYRNDREPAKRKACCSNLRLIAFACSTYAEANDDGLPESLETLVPQYLDNRNVPKCPSSNGAGGYTLVTGLRSDMPADFMVAYDSTLKNHNGDGRHVASINANIEWWPAKREAEFQKRLAEQAEKVKNWKHPAQKLPDSDNSAEGKLDQRKPETGEGKGDLNDGNPLVRDAAAEALKKIKGEEPPK